LCVCVKREKERGRQKKGNSLFFALKERMCVYGRVCVLACCVCLFVWTPIRKRGGGAETQQGSVAEKAPFDATNL